VTVSRELPYDAAHGELAEQRPAAVPAGRERQAAANGLAGVYGAGIAFWLVTRWLVLVHQGAWPWMNSFVVAAARGIVVGDWNDAVRPQLPAVLGVPLVLAGASEQQMVAALYLVASLVQYAAFIVLIRAVFPARPREQTLGLLVFLLVPFNHSIHHYRDMPVVLASAAIFLLAADFVRTLAPRSSASRESPPAFAATTAASDDSTPVPSALAPALTAAEASPSPSPPRPLPFTSSPSPARPSLLAKRSDQASHGASRENENASSGYHKTDEKRHADVTTWVTTHHFVEIGAVMLLGIWSRIEMLTFVAIMVIVALIIMRRAALRLAITYATAAIVVTGSLLLVYRLEDVDLSQAWFYTAHTFLDSTPDSWLSPECQANPTENCREADGLTYFGPADLHAGVLALAANHPLTTLAKSVRSAWDNLWVLLGSNLSTFPGVVPFLVLALALAQPVRELFRAVPAAVWVVVVAVLAESVLPPLTWAPPHPQYHVALVLPIALLLVPVLLALVRMPRGRLVALGFFVANAGLSAFRYTRYPGY
jgi:hypothetical protein